MTTTPPDLPDQWTIDLHNALNLTILTLRNNDNEPCEFGFLPLTDPTSPDRTIHSLNEITDAQLRDSAHELIATYFKRLEQLKRNIAAFNKAVPDRAELTTRLRRTVPDCRIEQKLNRETPTVDLILAATGPAAGQLLTLINSWPHATTNGTADGITLALDDTVTLTATLDQRRAQDFLTWYRDHSHGLEIEFDADSVSLSTGPDALATWTEDDWTKDPTVVFTIVSAVETALTEGPDALRTQLGQQPEPETAP
ncbi:hypothetical protein OG612_45640 (plasmid) [Streptomyces sp. NBC_01527]|uniref:hypothetical protein n=1 Tax=Streptomyces sp. NBC_01527 TaxID=2903894 RepID=UPI002F90AD98